MDNNFEIRKDELVGNLEMARSQRMVACSDGRIAFIENLQNVGTQGPVRLDAFIAVICLKGKASLYINGNLYEIYPGQVMICHPNIILEKSMNSMDFEFRCIALSKEYMQQMVLVGGTTSWDAINFLEKSPVISLTPEEVKAFCLYYDLIRSKLAGPSGKYQKELIDALLVAFLYEFRNSLEHLINSKPRNYTAGERVFHDFVKEITNTYPKPRSVAYYADKLCITSKYLSYICREVGGCTASDLINRYVVKDIQILLKRPDKNIKEICNELDFPNLSFFGKYVKAHLGVSPKAYREKMQQEDHQQSME